MNSDSVAEVKTTLQSLEDVLCRFLCLYFLLYFPTHLFVAPVLTLFFGKLVRVYTAAWNRVVPWVGEHILHLSHPITVRPGGSGDTTYNYVQVLVIAALALAGCLLWTLADRKRPRERSFVRWLGVACRYYLAFALLTYGFAKIFKTQFPSPSLERLIQPYGDSSPMGLAWTFMGYSTTYNLFTGLGEVLAALFLFFRRTTSLGALVALAILGNVVVMNFSYDIPVKLFSTHLLLMAVVLLYRDFQRITEVFILNRATSAVAIPPYFASSRGRLFYRIFKSSIIVAALVLTIQPELRAMKYGDRRPKPTLYGLYDIESFILDGATRPPLTTDEKRWQHLIVEYQGQLKVRFMDGTVMKVLYKPAPNALWVHRPGKREEQVLWSYSQPSPDVLEIEGEMDTHLFSARMKRRASEDFLLLRRSFHWISEAPFNH